MTKTKIFLDVDGVLNAVSKQLPDTGWDLEGWFKVGVNGYTITYNTVMIDAINEISFRDDVEIIWLTTWQSNAASKISPAIGLIGENWSFVANPDTDPHGFALQQNRYGWWKADVLKKYLEEFPTDKFIWVDDDLSYYNLMGLSEWTEDLDSSTLFIAPQTSDGLTPSHICAMIDFINEG